MSRDVDPLELGGEEVAVLDRHAGAVGGVGRGRVRGVADERDPALGPLLARLAVADLPALQVLAAASRSTSDGSGSAKRAGARQRELVEVGVERLRRVERLEHPPLVAPLALVADRGVAALGRAVVRDDGVVGRRAVEEQVAADQVQALVADRLVAPQRRADERAEAVGADDDVGLGGVRSAKCSDDVVAAVVERVTSWPRRSTPSGSASSMRLYRPQRSRPMKPPPYSAPTSSGSRTVARTWPSLRRKVGVRRRAEIRSCRRRSGRAPSAAAATG